MKIAFGTDAGVFPHGQNAKEFTALVNEGMAPIDAIRAATINAADLLQVHDRGEIKVGERADLIGVEQDPLVKINSLENISLVMIDGKVVK